ncbi:MAG: PQQ-dependent sugar dehydrogenase [Planctomycetes bacterium]|nr:PQQ-dependent sugar dehydrogenase [Planctomycetota bacterium]
MTATSMLSRCRHRVLSGGFAVFFLVLVIGSAHAATIPAGFAETQIATGLDPTTMTFAPDGRLFLCEKPGRVRVIKNGALLATPFADFTSVVDNTNERGLMSVCFDPSFSSNNWVYVYYTRKEGTRRFHRVGRYTASGDVASGGESVIIDLSDLGGAGNHNGGGLRFGQDGKLYISTGENANGANAQNTGNQLGKLLRINKDGSIPTDNPNYNNANYTGNNRAIVALGLRNAFTLAVQRTTGLLYVNDVGASYEEIHRYDTNVAPIHRNYGWSTIDGPIGSQTAPSGYANPVHAYNTNKSAICGGDFYNPLSPGGDAFPSSYTGKYFFCDYTGWIKYLDPSSGTRTDFATSVARPIDVEIAPDGALWYIARAGMGGGSDADNTSTTNGSLWRMRWTGGGQANRVAFIQQPSTINAGATISPAVRVAIQDSSGNTVTSSTATVTVAIGTNPGGATLAGTTTVAAVNGVATFSNLSLNNVGSGYTLTVSSSGLSGATSSTFNVQAQVATPVITPDGGSYSGPVWVQITTATSGTTIRYTTDGSTPNGSSSTYSGPFQRTATTTVRAYATRSDFSDSTVALATISVNGATAYGIDYRPPVTGIAMPAAVTGTMPGTLSGTGVFSTASSLTVKPGVVPYDMINPLWSDNADKRRWVALPGTAKIGFNATGEFTWPGGTVLVKHFEIAKSGGGTRRLETRVLVLDAAGTNGYGVTYKWRADNSEADLVAAGGQDEVLSDVAGSPTWRYPSRDQCLQCHTTTAGFVLGPKTRQLNRSYAYPSGRSDNQLRTWNYLQMFSNRIDEGAIAGLRKLVSITDTGASVETRVRSYLDSNCAGCHRPGGSGAAFDTRFDVAMDQQAIIHGDLRDALGISGAKVVVPRDLAKSVMHLRMQSNDPVRRMPPVGRNVVHSAAVDLIAQWIGALPNGSGLTGEYWTNQDKTFTGTATVTRTDAVVDFTWGNGSPDAAITADKFTVRWTGKVQPAVSETYTFFTTTDDGVRLWVNNQLVIDQWVDQAPTESSGSIALTGGTQYDVKLEYFENGGGAEAELRWSSPSTFKAIVPMYRLFPASGGSQTFASLVVTPASATVVNGGSVRFRGEARDGSGAPLSSQPTITWTVSGGGSIAADGTFTPSTVGGPYTVTGSATVSGVTRTNTSQVTVTAAFSAKINFQPASSPVPSGWQVDAGLVYGSRGNGLTYGWNAGVADTLRDRNLLSDQSRDTLVHLQKPTVPDAVWELAVPNGTYQVVAVSGDPGYFDGVFKTTAEGTLIINGTPTTGNRFVETVTGGATVIVSDGRLTLRSGSGAANNKLNSVEVVQVPVAIQ